jgi:hypothetical protein
MLLPVVLTACEKWLDKAYEAPRTQPVFFEYRHVNHAWGYAESGWLVDANGDIRTYDLPEKFIMPDSTGFISRVDLIQNLSQCDSTIHRVDAEDLRYYTGLISGAAQGKIGKAENIAADAGSSVLSCYIYDANEDMYRYVFLAASGDWQQFNESPEAEILVEWLKGLGVFWLSD